MQYSDIKRFIFKLDPETAHNIADHTAKALSSYAPFILKKISKSYRVDDNRLSQELFGVTFPNPIGIGAGFDKNATMVEGLYSVGFGYVEFGTLTPKPQIGNPRPRLFRYPAFNSIQNAMGFNNEGATKIKERVKRLYPYKIPLGANIGKNKTTSEKEAIKDYEYLINEFKDICDYLVINISSPNTPGLRDLQNEKFLKELFTLSTSLTSKPILLKIAPDLSHKEAISLSTIALESGAEGIIATNTTIDYSLLEGAKDFGGLSGEVLKEKSFELFLALAKEFYGKTTLISVGGIDSGEEAYKRLKAGANLIQILSALIFEGPSLVKNINLKILELMQKEGFNDIREVIGSDRK
jgi:dihydroorotate dehydrogenase